MNLKAEAVSRQYFRAAKNSNVFTALKELDFELAEGTLTVVSGRSGSGKSTMLNVLAGLLTPNTGRVLAGDTDLYALSDEERSRFRNLHIGVIPQGQTALRSLTVVENVMLPCRMYGDDVSEEDAVKALERVNIAHLKDTYPNELSGGEMRRLAIARALLRNPEILLADEPTADLDDENTRQVFELLRGAADSGMAVLLVTHERDASDYADAVYHMDDGTLTRK